MVQHNAINFIIILFIWISLQKQTRYIMRCLNDDNLFANDIHASKVIATREERVIATRFHQIMMLINDHTIFLENNKSKWSWLNDNTATKSAMNFSRKSPINQDTLLMNESILTIIFLKWLIYTQPTLILIPCVGNKWGFDRRCWWHHHYQYDFQRWKKWLYY